MTSEARAHTLLRGMLQSAVMFLVLANAHALHCEPWCSETCQIFGQQCCCSQNGGCYCGASDQCCCDEQDKKKVQMADQQK